MENWNRSEWAKSLSGRDKSTASGIPFIVSLSSAEAVGVALASFICYRAELICCRSRPISLSVSLLFVDKRNWEDNSKGAWLRPAPWSGMWWNSLWKEVTVFLFWRWMGKRRQITDSAKPRALRTGRSFSHLSFWAVIWIKQEVSSFFKDALPIPVPTPPPLLPGNILSLVFPILLWVMSRWSAQSWRASFSNSLAVLFWLCQITHCCSCDTFLQWTGVTMIYISV